MKNAVKIVKRFESQPLNADRLKILITLLTLLVLSHSTLASYTIFDCMTNISASNALFLDAFFFHFRNFYRIDSRNFFRFSQKIRKSRIYIILPHVKILLFSRLFSLIKKSLQYTRLSALLSGSLHFSLQSPVETERYSQYLLWRTRLLDMKCTAGFIIVCRRMYVLYSL